MRDKRVVVIGGGTGLSTMLKGLRERTKYITAIVNVSDNGGSSGVLRDEYEIASPGDIRNCINSLIRTTPELDNFLNYRFEDGFLEGHAMGNIILAGLCKMYNDDIEKATESMCRIFNAQGSVIPVTNENITLAARLDNGIEIIGESQIGTPREDGSTIVDLYSYPKNPCASTQAVKAIENADIIVLGPGSLFTSIISNLIVDGIPQAIKKSKALKLYVCNIMTEPGETDDFSAYDHLREIEKYIGVGIIDFVLAHKSVIPEMLEIKYAGANSYPVVVDTKEFLESKTPVVRADYVIIRDDYIRHNFSRLARIIMKIGTSFDNLGDRKGDL